MTGPDVLLNDLWTFSLDTLAWQARRPPANQGCRPAHTKKLEPSPQAASSVRSANQVRRP